MRGRAYLPLRTDLACHAVRIVSVEIQRWRNLEGVSFQPPAEANLICLVGENGTGKTAALELLALASHCFGLSPQLQERRATDWPAGTAATVTLEVSDPPLLDAYQQHAPEDPTRQAAERWNGRLLFRFPDPEGGQGIGVGQNVYADGIDDNQIARSLGANIAHQLNGREELNYVFIGSDRAGAEISVSDHDLLQALKQDTRQPAWLRQQASMLTQNRYAEWIKAVLSESRRRADQHWRAANEAKRRREPQPEPLDPLEGYREAVMEVLPHLEFVAVDDVNRTLLFRSAGAVVPFQDLSGGEREIAFLVGQIDLFALQRGLLLLDEPELHLNAELLRRWLRYVRRDIEDGQVWIATHALEAVEVASPEATFVFEREEPGPVRSARAFAERPVLGTLASAVGSPAFSLTRSRFVLVEGRRELRERERFALLCPDPPDGEYRFLEAGGCGEVIRRFSAVRDLAAETDQRLIVGGIVDRDHREIREVTALERGADGLFVLPVHEIENFFLHPAALAALLERRAGATPGAHEVLRGACDSRAGLWVLNRASLRSGVDAAGQIKAIAAELTWDTIEDSPDDVVARLLAIIPAETAARETLEEGLRSAIDGYRRLRDDEARLWRECEGKETVKTVVAAVGASDSSVIEEWIAELWRSNELAPPDQLVALRDYVAELAPI